MRRTITQCDTKAGGNRRTGASDDSGQPVQDVLRHRLATGGAHPSAHAFPSTGYLQFNVNSIPGQLQSIHDEYVFAEEVAYLAVQVAGFDIFRPGGIIEQ